MMGVIEQKNKGFSKYKNTNLSDVHKQIPLKLHFTLSNLIDNLDFLILHKHVKHWPLIHESQLRSVKVKLDHRPGIRCNMKVYLIQFIVNSRYLPLSRNIVE